MSGSNPRASLRKVGDHGAEPHATFVQVSNVSAYRGPLLFSALSQPDDGFLRRMWHSGKTRRETFRLFWNALWRNPAWFKPGQEFHVLPHGGARSQPQRGSRAHAMRPYGCAAKSCNLERPGFEPCRIFARSAARLAPVGSEFNSAFMFK